MTYWVFMVIMFGHNAFGVDDTAYRDTISLIPFKGDKECGDAILTMDAILRHNFPDLVITCVPTQIIATSIRPEPHPEHLEGAW